jgi:hypothetical protein
MRVHMALHFSRILHTYAHYAARNHALGAHIAERVHVENAYFPEFSPTCTGHCKTVTLPSQSALTCHPSRRERRLRFLRARFDCSSHPAISYFQFRRTLPQQTAHVAIPRKPGLALDHSWPVHLLTVYFAAIPYRAAPAARWTHRCTLSASQLRAPRAHNPEPSTRHTLNTSSSRRTFADHAPLAALRAMLPPVMVSAGVRSLAHVLRVCVSSHGLSTTAYGQPGCATSLLCPDETAGHQGIVNYNRFATNWLRTLPKVIGRSQ